MNPPAVKNLRTGATLATEAFIARTFWARLKGLLGSDELPPGHSLLIVPCNSVHGFGMRYAIDVLFLKKDGTVMACVPGLKPWKMSPIVRGARAALELPAGTIAATGTRKGDRLAMPPIP